VGRRAGDRFSHFRLKLFCGGLSLSEGLVNGHNPAWTLTHTRSKTHQDETTAETAADQNPSITDYSKSEF